MTQGASCACGYLHIFPGEISKSLAHFLIGLFFGVIELFHQDFKTMIYAPHLPSPFIYKHLLVYLAIPGLSCGARDLFFSCGVQTLSWGFPSGSVVKNPPANVGDAGDVVQSLGQDDTLQQEMATHSSILPRKSYGQKSLVGYSQWGGRVRHG